MNEYALGHFYAVTFLLLTLHLAGATDSSCLFTGALFRWLFKMPTQFHFAINAFALQFLFQGPKRLINIVFANHNLHKNPHSAFLPAWCRADTLTPMIW
jgi:hypothetical protein